jgi:hypothetical protein
VRPCLYSLKPFIKLRRRPILVVVPAGAKLQLIISWVQRREFHECNSSTLLLKLQSPGEIIINLKKSIVVLHSANLVWLIFKKNEVFTCIHQCYLSKTLAIINLFICYSVLGKSLYIFHKMNKTFFKIPMFAYTQQSIFVTLVLNNDLLIQPKI